MTLRQASLGLLTATIIYSAGAAAAATAPEIMLKQAMSHFATDAAKAQVREKKTDSPAELRQSIVDYLVDLFDINGMAAQVAGPAWEKASAQTREQFTGALTMTIVHDWTPKLQKLRNENVSLDITPLKTTGGAQHALFNVIIRSAHTEDIPLTLKLVKYPRAEQKDTERSQRWLVEDVVASGQSMVKNYSDQYRVALTQRGLASVTKQLKAQLPAPAPEAIKDRLAWLQLKILVLPDGTPDEVKVIRSSGYSDLDDAAIQTVEDWHFKPAKRDGSPIKGYALQRIVFGRSADNPLKKDR